MDVNELVPLLRAPGCGEKLRLQEQRLVCETCGFAFETDPHGIHVLLPGQAAECTAAEQSRKTNREG
ncbi:hypothetical protein APED_30210 [Acanthopleuribacter pedis]